ncbi:MAG: Fe-S cluster assembly protein SufB, partial [Patescibacteria group bacterium]
MPIPTKEKRIIRKAVTSGARADAVRVKSVFRTPKGLTAETVTQISDQKKEPQWMKDFRTKAYQTFLKKKMPSWGADLSTIDFDAITYYVRPQDRPTRSWDEVPSKIRQTFDKLGIPEQERRFLAGAGAQFESEVVYHSLQESLQKQGVIFESMDEGLRKYPEIVKEYFGKIVPPTDNKFAALNSAVWSGGSFVYIPKDVHVTLPLQAYFRINEQSMGQFERTLIVAEEGSSVHYVEGCTAPTYSSDSLHSAVVEIFVKKNARVQYTTIQNWSGNVYNLVTKRAIVYEGGEMFWLD